MGGWGYRDVTGDLPVYEQRRDSRAELNYRTDESIGRLDIERTTVKKKFLSLCISFLIDDIVKLAKKQRDQQKGSE